MKGERLNQIREMGQRLMEHREKFAAAFLKETGLDPTQVVMVQQTKNGQTGFWFRPKTEAEKRLDVTTAHIEDLSDQLRVYDQLIEQRNRLLHMPGLECSAHGSGCVPGAMEKVEALLRIAKAAAARPIREQWAEERVATCEYDEYTRAGRELDLSLVAWEEQWH